MDSYVLTLSENPLRFEPLRKMTSIFYDNESNEIFTIIHAEDVLQIIVENTSSRKNSIYYVKHIKRVISLKFSTDQKILAIQHDKTSIDFISFHNGSQTSSFTQSSKTINTEILGFIWVTSSEVLFVTSCGLELYQVEFGKKALKYLKCVNLNVTWFLYYPKTKLILLCTGNGAFLQPFYVVDGNFNKLPRVEIESSPFQKQIKPNTIHQKDVILTSCYGHTRVLIFQHSHGGSFPGTDIVVYTINKTAPPKKTHILKLNICGRFAVNVVDDLVVVHHQVSKTSFLFDFGLSVREEDSVSVLKPVIEAMSIKPPTDVECELYSSHWVTFQPNIVIDVGIGAFWHLNLNLNTFLVLIRDKCTLTDFLLQRTAGKEYLIKMLNEVMTYENRNLEEIATLFNRLNVVYKDKLELEFQSQVGLPVSSSVTVQVYKPVRLVKIVLNQLDMCNNVFSKVANHAYESSSKNRKFFIWILLEYIRSLTDCNVLVQHCINELLINTLVRNRCFNELHQILQYHVISDSKPLACVLLSLENIYPPAHQLALDMLHRMKNATEEITEVLLSKQHVISALRYSDTYGTESEISYRKFLDIAHSVDDSHVFYSIFVELENRDKNSTRSVSQFTAGGHCDKYVKSFQERYRKNAIKSEN